MPKGYPNPKPEEDREPEVVESPVAPVESVQSEVSEPCWNCGHQLQGNICDNCGFDKSLLYNLDLEEAKAKERKEKQNAKPSTA